MKLTDSEKKQIEKHLTTECPLCGGRLLHSTMPLRLVALSCHTLKEGLFDERNIEAMRSYICGECQNCGYTILRNMDVMLRKDRAK